MPEPQLLAVAFDLDGLMFNTERLYCIVEKKILERRGHLPNAELNRQMTGRPARVAIPMMIDWFQLDATVEELQCEVEENFASLLDTHLQPMPGLVDLLTRIQDADIPKAITTSSRLEFVEKLLSISQIGFQFDFFLTSDDITQGKPHPEIYLKAASRFGVSPEQMMVLEDSEIGCQAAVAANTFAVAVPEQKSLEHSFDGAKLVCAGLADDRIATSLGLS